MSPRPLDAEIEGLILISETSGIGSTLLAKLLFHFGSVRGVLESSDRELDALRLSPRVVNALRIAAKKRLSDEQRQTIEKTGVSFISLLDADYPPTLRSIPDPPPLLYVRGELQDSDSFSATIVGTRRASREGCEKAYQFASELARNGVTIVSGFAAGIDAAAHTGALDVGGRTLAVMGHGLAHLYPPEHKRLAGRILSSGALLSELPVETKPRGKYFPRRNRLLSGLTLVTLVVEAPLRSGALSTARFAWEQGNRGVFVVSWEQSSRRNEGLRDLLEKGARPCRKAQEIFDVLKEMTQPGTSGEFLLRREEKEKQPFVLDPSLSEAKDLLWNVLGTEPTHVDALIQLTGLSPQKALSALMLMRLEGKVRQYPGNRFVRCESSS